MCVGFSNLTTVLVYETHTALLYPGGRIDMGMAPSRELCVVNIYSDHPSLLYTDVRG